jgi:hypothetical protein
VVHRVALRRLALGVVAFGLLAAGCGSASHSRPRVTHQSHAPAGANLWVSTGGGTCIRQSPAGAEIPSQDCNSLNAAYMVASCGDVVNIDAGTYPAEQNLLENPALDHCASPVVFRAAPGVPRSAVVFSWPGNAINDYDGCCGGGLVGASNWVLQNVTVRGGIYWNAKNVKMENIRAGSFTLSGTGMTVEHSNLGPCYNLISLPAGDKNSVGAPGPTYSPDPSVECNSNIKIGANDVLFKDNVIHDFLDDDSNSYFGHFECVFIASGTNIVFDSNKFYDCQIYSIFLQDYAGPISDVTIENNWFWANQGGMGSCTADRRCPAESVAGYDHDAVTFGATNTGISDVLIRYNSFDPCCGISQEGSQLGSNIRAVGNILGGPTAGGCIPGVAFSYNLWQGGGDGGPCGPTDKAISGSPYVRSGTSGPTPADLHLRCGTVAHDLVKPNSPDYQLGYDIDGNPRNPSGPRDAGSSAEAACHT